jgi:predicted permease
MAPAGIPRLDDPGVSGGAVALVITITGLMGGLFGALPALRVQQGQLQHLLRHGRTMTTDRRGQRLRRALVVSELALALALLLSASLLLRSFTRLAAYDPGFELENLLTFWVAPPMWRYESRELRREYYRRVERDLGSLPGVIAVGTASAGPLLGGGDGRTPFIVRGGGEEVAPEDAPTAAWYDAGPGWFGTLGVPVVAGRNLSAQPADGEVVEALINESMAKGYLASGSPVGKRLWLPDWELDAVVVGVVADLQDFGVSTPPDPAIYVSNVQRPRGSTFFVIRTTGDPLQIVPAVQRVLKEIDPDAEPRYVETMEELLRDELVAPRFTLLLIGIFAGLALVLSASGVYAVISYTVAQRTREFGIRLALGSRAAQVLRLVLGDSARMLAGGLVLGGVGALFFTRLLRGLTHDVVPTDVPAVVLTIAILALSAFAAAAVPAMRAARTQPAVVLRSE